MSTAGGNEGRRRGGSRKGIPNRATSDARAAFALLLEGNVGRFQAWLNAVADGERQPKRNRDGSAVVDAQGNPVMDWLRPPDPGYAMRLLLDVAEYHIPRLARTEINGELGLHGTLIIDG